jgi:redox-sensitive bicupin YhaK (pirin superfamily)
MIRLRPSAERGYFDHGWLRTFHTFSFAGYHDPAHMGFRALRVINEDQVQPGMGFGTHPHADMEILTWVLEGSLAHKDSMGNGSSIGPDEAQRMTAGTGITHSEFNGSRDQAVHLLQIWILPEREGLTPGYEQKKFPRPGRLGRLTLIGSRDGREGSVTLHQDVSVLAGALEHGTTVEHRLAPGRHAWVQVTAGSLDLVESTPSPARGGKGEGAALKAGDGAAVSEAGGIRLSALEPADFLVFDLA